MNPFYQTLIVSAITGGTFTAILTFVQFLIKRHDDKKDKKTGIQAELARHGEQLDQITGIVEDVQHTVEEQGKTQKKQGDAIVGLEHDRIVHVGKGHIREHHISLEDYDDINTYLFQPYKALGGNGTAEKIMVRLEAMVEKEDEG